MKRIQSACLSQTIHFQLKDDLGHDYAVRQVQSEVEAYKLHLDRSHTKYCIEEEQTQKDGSIVLKIKKQLNQYDVGSYLD